MTIKELSNVIKSWQKERKVALLLVFVLTLLGIYLIVQWSNRIDYVVLYSNLSQEDAANIVSKLKELKVNYKIEGNTIFVPSDNVHELRLTLASSGIPQGGGVGFEIFDRSNIGITEFVQRLNYRRALQGELARTIKQLKEVASARVHLSIPEKTIFSEKQDKPKASVVITMKSGRVLSRGQVASIIHLVASSVDGMSSSDVTVIDSNGGVLASPENNDNTLLSAKQITYQREIEKNMERRLKSMFEGLVGKGKAIVRVSAELDFTQQEMTEEKFAPEGVVKNEEIVKEKTSGKGPGGIPGVTSNQPGQTIPPSNTSNQSQRQQENIVYEISKTVSRKVLPVGQIKKLSVAVLVDGTMKEENGVMKNIPRTKEELKRYEEIVKTAIGFNQKRGDKVVVVNEAFKQNDASFTSVEKADYLQIILKGIKYLAPMAFMLLFFLFILKPLMKTVKGESLRVKLPQTVEEIENAMETKTTQEIGHDEKETSETKLIPLKEEVANVVKKDPTQAAKIIKSWIDE